MGNVASQTASLANDLTNLISAESALGDTNANSSFASSNNTVPLSLIAENLTNNTLSASAFAQFGGYAYMATTTRYGDADASACGAMSTAALVAGTGYYQVASAQSMQGGDCCWCGKSSSLNGYTSGTAPMGCLQCAKGRFINRKPNYGRRLMSNSGFASSEIHVVVGDLCPHVGNEHWCPAQPGQTNAVGSKNHFDFSHPPAGIDNNYFVFTPVECSPQLKQRMRAMSRCQR